MRWIAVGLAIGATACVQPQSVPCGDGIVCPTDTVCVHTTTVTLCVDANRRELCRGIAEGELCDDSRGRCYDTTCVLITCGDRLIDPGSTMLTAEACDDGNTLGNDGCSADCLSDETCGNGVVDPLEGELCDDGNPWSHDGCGARCQPEQPHWTEQFTGPPGPQTSPALVYINARSRIMMFGGDDTKQATWTWDGHGWLQFQSASQFSPVKRSDTAATYDPVHKRVLLYGGARDGVPPRLFDDLWQWDGDRWFQLADGPAALGTRKQHALAYDMKRQRLVLFGGVKSLSQPLPLGDTWEWDGVEWKLVATSGPPARARHAMTYDPQLGQVVMYGGESASGASFLDDLWTWDGTTWSLLTPATGAKPAARTGAGMAAYHGGLLVAGGSDTSALTDTWFWSGSAWTSVATTGPTSTAGVALATDLQRDRVVMAGGNVDEVWEWDGLAWSKAIVAPEPAVDTMHAAHDLRRDRGIIVVDNSQTFELVDGTWRVITGTPPAQQDFAVAYDVARDQTVLFGGVDLGNGLNTNRTWTRTADGPWREVFPATKPPARDLPMMTYDRSRERVVMYGGLPGGDTWEWDGTTWTEKTPTGTSPPERYSAALNYDPVRHVTVLFGGRYATTLYGDVWEWDGTTWTERIAIGARPAARIAGVLGWNPARRRLTLFGGYDYDNTFGDTWEWDGTAWTAIVTELRPPGSAGHASVPARDGTGVVFAGGLEFRFGASWRLVWDGEAPHEQCRGGIDEDGDGLVACGDPDCWTVCSPLCGPGETCTSSTPRCGDGVRGPTETCQACPDDFDPCPACGDLACAVGEVCAADCP